jgi:hypothetical protein
MGGLIEGPSQVEVTLVVPTYLFVHEFHIVGFGAGSTISFNTDAGPQICHTTDRCRATGSWDPVPEPSTLGLIGLGLLGLGAMKRRRKWDAKNLATARV